MISFQRNRSLTFKSGNRRRNLLYITIGLLALSFLLIVKTYFFLLSDFILDSAGNIHQFFKERRNTLSQLHHAKDEIEVLKKQLTTNKLNLLMYKDAMDENQSLLKLLGLKEKHVKKFVPIEYKSYHSILGADDYVFEKSTQDTVNNLNPVFSEGSIVGMVVAVKKNRISAVPLTDRRVQIPVNIKRLGKRFIMQGTGHSFMRLRFITDSEDIKINDKVTVDMNGSSYDVGSVSDIEHLPGELFSLVTIRPERMNFNQQYFAVLNESFGSF